MATSTIHYAVEIDTGTTETDTDIGLNSGVIRLVTDRPGYDGVTVIPTLETGGNITDVYYEGIISKDGVGNATRSCIDLDKTGGYGSASNFILRVDNSDKFWEHLETLDINLTGKVLQLYVVIDDVFYYAYNGMISNNPRDETDYDIVCSSDHKRLHKVFPPNTLDKAQFPETEDRNSGGAIPVCIGDVYRARIYNTIQRDNFILLHVKSGRDYYSAAADQILGVSDNNIIYPVVNLITEGVTFETNELQGLYLVIFQGIDSDPLRYIQIRSSSTTTSSRTAVTLEDDLGKTIADASANNTYSSGSDEDTWFFKITTTRYDGIISNDSLSSLDQENPQIRTFTFNNNTNKYVRSLGVVNSVTNNGQRDVLSLNTSQLNENGEIDVTTNLGLNKDQTDTFRDDDRSTYTSNTLTTLPQAQFGRSYNITDEVVENAKNSDALYIGYDMSLIGASSKGVSLSLNYILIDQYLNTYSAAVNTDKIYLSSGTNVIGNLIPNAYYGENGNDNDEDDTFGKYDNNSTRIKPILEMPSDMKEAIASGIISFITVACNIERESGTWTGDEWRIKNVSIFSVDSVKTDEGDLYTKIKGEEYSGSESNSVNIALPLILENYDGVTFRDYSNLNSTRSSWRCGRQVTDIMNSFDYIRQLAKHAFLEIVVKRTGQLLVTSFRDLSTSVETFNENNINRDSIKSWTETTISNLYNEFILKYNWNPGLDDYDRTLGITKIDDTAFPAQYESTGTDTSESYTTCELDDSIGTTTIETSYDPTSTFPVGSYTSYDNGSGGVFWYFSRVTAISGGPTVWFVKGELPSVYGAGGVPSSGGTLYANGNNIRKWETYAQGFSSYSIGKNLWDQANDSYNRMGQVRTLPDELSNLPWYIDEDKFDDDEDSTANSTYAVFKYLDNLVSYITRQKNRVTFDIPLDSDNITRELIDYVTFNDTIYTNSENYPGYIEKITLLPGSDTMRLTLLLIPSDLPESGIIEETMSASDIIEETTSATDIIEEVL